MPRLFSYTLALCALAGLGCGPIPKDPVSSNGDVDLAYINEVWGFQISRPTPFWGISVQTFPLQRDPNNGLPRVDVRISSPQTEFPNAPFRPELRMEPRGLARGTHLDDLARSFESELKTMFEGYGAVGEKRRVVLQGGEGLVWEFANSIQSPNRIYPGTMFLAAVVLRGRDGFYIIANGSAEGYPLVAYNQIVSSLGFQE